MNARKWLDRGFLALVLLSCGCRPPRTLAGAGPADASGSWEASVSADGKILIRHKGAQVARGNYVFWGDAWKFAMTQVTVEPGGAGVQRLQGEISNLGLSIRGEIRSPKPEVLQIDYQIRATKALNPIIGGGIGWQLKMDSPSFGGDAPRPQLIPDKLGWTWPFAGGRALTVKFSEPTAFISQEGAKGGQIRTFFVFDKVEPGTRSFRMTLELPPGGRVVPSAEERYGPAETSRWYRDALRWDVSPVDLSGLNADEKPAGRRGFVGVKGDQLVFADGTPARFWGGNIAAYTLFGGKPEIAAQSRRISQLGYNLMRLHHHDSKWVKPNVIAQDRQDSRRLDADALDRIDWWIKCLKDEGVYIWLDLHVGREFKPGDPIGSGFDELRKANGMGKGFNYLNPDVAGLIAELGTAYLNHVNPYTGLAYKADPAIMSVLITNENDMTGHGYFALPDKGNPVHSAMYMKAAKAFADSTGLSPEKIWRAWEPGQSKIFLNELEHRFNVPSIANLRKIGVRVPIATTNYWGDEPISSLPALADGDIIDVHSYGLAEALGTNPRYEANYIDWIASGQVEGKPLTITEWNVPYPLTDRFTAPLYVAGIASLQGWDAPMIYNYSQAPLRKPQRGEEWSTSFDPALTGVMPAAAVAFRRRHIRPAAETYALDLGRDRFFETVTPANSATIRTLAERSRLVISLPETKELPWLKKTSPGAGVKVVDDPNRDFIPAGQDFVESDTGELRRDWARGIETINTPKTQAVLGWVGGESIALKDVSFRFQTRKVSASVTSLDDRPIAESRSILITTVGRVVSSPVDRTPLLSEPVVGQIRVRAKGAGLKLVSLAADGRPTVEPRQPAREGDALVLNLPTQAGTHWYLLKADPAN